jgi:hypothetical protein
MDTFFAKMQRVLQKCQRFVNITMFRHYGVADQQLNDFLKAFDGH